ncbi:hypothetical protein [Hyphomonas chukchiensis]|uniref:hypothetical protein n=1 Tax=Hyphomonas chukchiensis TaxID=1280947 RepID=UPI0030FAC6CF
MRYPALHLTLVAILFGALGAASAQTYYPDDHSEEYQADYSTAYDKCMAPYRERAEQAAAAKKACEEKGENLCMPFQTGVFSQFNASMCDELAQTQADNAERSRKLAQSVGTKGPDLPKAATSTASVKLPGLDKPAIKTPVTLPAAVRPKSGLTLTVPVKVTNFHTSWNGQQLASGDASMIVACRVIANDYSVTGEVHSGFTELPPIAEGGSLDTSVDVFIDANVLGLGDDYGNTAECLLMRPDMDKSEDTFLGITMENAPMRACGEWNDNPAQCRVVIY